MMSPSSSRWSAAVSLLALTSAFAQAPAPSLARLDLVPRQGTSEAAIQPIFSQIVLFAMPDGFHALPPILRKGHYVQQSVPTHESAARWTQMITVTGDEALAFSGRTYPQKMVDDFVARTKRTCPDSFGAAPLPNVFVGSYDTAVAVAGCGSAAGGQSETTMQMVVKGGMDVYTFEWAVRGPASRGPLKIDPSDWTARLLRLAPVRVCAVVANEQPPYPSCLWKRDGRSR